MKVTLVAATYFYETTAEHLTGWCTDAYGGQALVEFAGRACFQSWKKPNPATATNAGYITNILRQGHLSVLEHAQATFYVEQVSRSLSHELIRHRHLSYSQLSQRYVDESDVSLVPPPIIESDPELLSWWRDTVGDYRHDYHVMATELGVRFPEAKRKEIRQAARSLLPNAAETKIVVTGNWRAWREFIAKRATEHADVEIRALAVEILRQLQRVAPNVFDDFEITTLEDGTEVAASPIRGD